MIGVPDVPFSFFDNDYTIKGIKDIPVYSRTIEIKILKGQLLDEIATKPEVYGEGKEFESYKIFEANVAALVDAKFDLSNIKTLKIPV